MKGRAAVIFVLLGAAGFLALRPAFADYKQAVAYYKQGRFDRAIQELKPDLDANPEWEFGQRLAGLCYLNLNNNALAISSLTRAVQLKSTAFATYQGLGQAFYNLERFDNCIQSLDQGAQFATQPADQYYLHHLKGSAYYRLENYEKAVTELQDAIRIRATDWTDFSQLGIALYNRDRFDDASEALLKALALKPGHNVTMEYLGKCYFKRGVAALSAKDFRRSIELFQKASLYQPNDGFIYYNTAEAYLFQNRFAEAEKELDHALSLLPRSAEVLQRLGLIYEKQKKWDKSLDAYRKANEINPSPGLEESIKRVTELKKR